MYHRIIRISLDKVLALMIEQSESESERLEGEGRGSEGMSESGSEGDGAYHSFCACCFTTSVPDNGGTHCY